MTNRTILLLLNSLCWQALHPFIFFFFFSHLLFLCPGWTCVNWQQRYMLRLYSCMSVHMSDLSSEYVSLVVLVSKWFRHTEIKSPPSHPLVFLAGTYYSHTELQTPLICLAGWHVRGYFVLIPAMNAAHRLSLGPLRIQTTRNHTFLSVTFIFICASSNHSFLSLSFSPLEIITSHVRRGEKSVALPLKFLIV